MPCSNAPCALGALDDSPPQRPNRGRAPVMPWPDSRRHPPHSPLLRDVRSSPSAVTPASRVAPLALRGTRSTRKPGDSAAAPSIDIPRSGRSAGCSTTKDYRVPPSRKGTYSLCHCLAALTSRFPQPRRPRCSHTAHDEHNPPPHNQSAEKW